MKIVSAPRFADRAHATRIHRRIDAILFLIIIAIVVLIARSSAHAATKRWDGGGGNVDWGTANNWDTNGVPGSIDNILLDNVFVATLPALMTTTSLSMTVMSITLDSPNSITLGNSGGSSSTSTITLTGAGDAGNTLISLTSNATGTFTIEAQASGNRLLSLVDGSSGTMNVSNSAGVLNITASISGTNSSLTKTGAGTLTLAPGGATAGPTPPPDTYSGSTTINGGTLKIDNNNTTTARLASTSGISINSGGILLLSQTGMTSTDRINNGATVTVNNGGTFNTAGLSEGSSTAGSTQGIGALTLQGGSTIDFKTGANGSTLLASSGSVSGAGTISILNWTGTLNADNGLATNDRLLFVTDPGLTSAQLAQFQFFNDAGLAFGVGAREIQFNGFTEIVAAPEPSTWLAAALTLIAIGYIQRRKLVPALKRVSFHKS